ncbi:hypothetical protein [Limnohabitans sp. 63ED37-2]|uniref:hypothetical protein n=1 Tax=Limnohabitans sp. 63ED37-2 TaxID=1678128 RepID=UPI001E439EA0|nr:hypothetical protein [Limnohabitans sp. 63ED37-2]
MASDFLAGTEAAFFTGLAEVAGAVVALGEGVAALGATLPADFAGVLAATGAGTLAGALAGAFAAALALATGAVALTAAVLATILDLAGAWAGFFGF